MVTGQAPVTLELRNTPGKKTQTKGGTRIYHSSRNSCLRQKHIQSEIGSQPTMCQVRTGAYVSLLAPEKTDYTACHPRKSTTYILHVVPITTHTHDRRKSIGKKKQRNENKIKERKRKKRRESEKTNTRKGKRRKDKKTKRRQDKKRKQGKEKRKMSYQQTLGTD